MLQGAVMAYRALCGSVSYYFDSRRFLGFLIIGGLETS